MLCKYCGEELKVEQKTCLNCGQKNLDFKSKKNIIIYTIVGVLILIAIYIGITDNNLSSKTSVTSSTSESDATDVIFDAKKLIGAKKQDVDVLLNIKGTQDTNEPYVCHYGDDIDVVFDDNGICLDLCLDTDGKEYKSYDETKIFKSYGIELTDSYYKQSNENVKTYTKIKEFGEIDIFYNFQKGDSPTDIKQIVFYTESSKKLNDFLEKKSESFENESNNNSNSNFIFDEATGKIKKYTGTDSTVVIPNQINGVKVVNIGEDAFINGHSLTNITIPDSVTSIEKMAFTNCDKLTSLTIPNGVTSIGEDAFGCCRSLTSITIPERVTSIANMAFVNCNSLTSITIPHNITSIGEYAFENCYNLRSITIADGVTSIGKGAFGDCKNAKIFVKSKQAKQLLIKSGVDASKIIVND
ncbi:leucine-rich repeat domain-containing protein [Clostridium sp.]|uniref:leucine-rich repeat domain-containing protein n=1 Tax=Clostridium sp. TaxID=1506 RepID=UPI0028508AD1|nr:leucine-rich repeat domain-containing protein [Clostridium sp.]MDR3594157.1 leucine-rich repeat domain-containing protein [Clostridium sp.]